jgi:hypothetical protein
MASLSPTLKPNFRLYCAALIGISVISSAAQAAPICGAGSDPNEVMISVNAESETHSGTYAVHRGDGYCGDNGQVWSWSYNDPSHPIPIMDGVDTVASFTRLGATMFGDPAVNVVYGVSAGPAPTIFTISSGAVIAPIVNPTAGASAANTLTDTNGNGDAGGCLWSRPVVPGEEHGGTVTG